MGSLPSRLIRRILPLRLFRFWAAAHSPASPMPIHSLPKRSISSAQPLWMVLARMPPQQHGAAHPAAVVAESCSGAPGSPSRRCCVVARRADVDESVGGEVDVDGDAHQAGLALRPDGRDGDGAGPGWRRRHRSSTPAPGPARSVTSIVPSGTKATSHGIDEAIGDDGGGHRRSGGRRRLRGNRGADEEGQGEDEAAASEVPGHLAPFTCVVAADARECRGIGSSPA